MPLFDGNEYKRALDSRLGAAYPETLVYHLKETGEIFTDYEEYLLKQNLVSLRKWTCEATGQSNLTYTQAKQSESRVLQKCIEQIPMPTEMTRQIFKMVQYNIDHLNEILDETLEFINSHVFKGELVQVLVDQPNGSSETRKGKITSFLLENGQEHDQEFAQVSDFRLKFLVELSKETLVVDYDHLKRDRSMLTKKSLRNFIKNACTRTSTFVGSAWVVSPFLLKSVGLDYLNTVEYQSQFKLKERKPKIAPSQLEFPVDDIELLSMNIKGPKQSSGEWPKPCFLFEDIPETNVPLLLESWAFLNALNVPLKLSKFTLEEFIWALKETHCTLITEIFGSLLSVACKEYSKIPSSEVLSDPINFLPNTDQQGSFEEYLKVIQQLDTNQALCIQQWFKWQPGKWAGKKNSRMLAWQVVLIGLLVDWMSSESKWSVVFKLLTGEEKEASSSSDYSSNSSSEEERETLYSRLRTRRESKELSVSSSRPQRKQKSPKKKKQEPEVDELKLAVQDLSKQVENRFHLITVEEKLGILGFLIEVCVIPSHLIRKHADLKVEEDVELRKEQRELLKELKSVSDQKREIYKKIEQLDKRSFGSVEVVTEEPAELEEGDMYSSLKKRATDRLQKLQDELKKGEEDEEVEEEAFLNNRRVHEAKEREQERRSLEAQERHLKKKQRSLELQLKQDYATSRLRPLGRDRFYNRYWWFDSGLGIDALDDGKPKQRGRWGERHLMWFSGRLFIEYYGLSETDCGLEQNERFRQGFENGRWGYYTEPVQLDQLMEWLDPRGTRESILLASLERYVDDMALIMSRKNEQIIKAAQDSKDEHLIHGSYCNKMV